MKRTLQLSKPVKTLFCAAIGVLISTDAFARQQSCGPDMSGYKQVIDVTSEWNQQLYLSADPDPWIAEGNAYYALFQKYCSPFYAPVTSMNDHRRWLRQRSCHIKTPAVAGTGATIDDFLGSSSDPAQVEKTACRIRPRNKRRIDRIPSTRF